MTDPLCMVKLAKGEIKAFLGSPSLDKDVTIYLISKFLLIANCIITNVETSVTQVLIKILHKLVNIILTIASKCLNS